MRVRVRARVTWETGKPSASRSSQRALSASKLLLMQVVKTWLGFGFGFGFGFGLGLGGGQDLLDPLLGHHVHP